MSHRNVACVFFFYGKVNVKFFKLRYTAEQRKVFSDYGNIDLMTKEQIRTYEKMYYKIQPVIFIHAIILLYFEKILQMSFLKYIKEVRKQGL